jgi:hypothetical protein
MIWEDVPAPYQKALRVCYYSLNVLAWANSDTRHTFLPYDILDGMDEYLHTPSPQAVCIQEAKTFLLKGDTRSALQSYGTASWHASMDFPTRGIIRREVETIVAASDHLDVQMPPAQCVPQPLAEDVLADLHTPDLGELHTAFKECIVLPIMFPQFFQSCRTPPRTTLCFGPSDAIAVQILSSYIHSCNADYFVINGADMGPEGLYSIEWLRRVCEEISANNNPSVLLLRDIDRLCGTARMYTELVSQLDQLTQRSKNTNIHVVGTTTIPWVLPNTSILRRFNRRIFLKDGGTTKMSSLEWEERYKLFIEEFCWM